MLLSLMMEISLTSAFHIILIFALFHFPCFSPSFVVSVFNITINDVFTRQMLRAPMFVILLSSDLHIVHFFVFFVVVLNHVLLLFVLFLFTIVFRPNVQYMYLYFCSYLIHSVIRTCTSSLQHKPKRWKIINNIT